MKLKQKMLKFLEDKVKEIEQHMLILFLRNGENQYSFKKLNILKFLRMKKLEDIIYQQIMMQKNMILRKNVFIMKVHHNTFHFNKMNENKQIDRLKNGN